MSTADIRWQQRLSNYNKAFLKLEVAVQRIISERTLENEGIFADDFMDDIIKEGLIQRFEYTYELACHVMRDFLMDAGSVSIFGSKDAIREAFSTGLIDNGEVWMDMYNSRNKTSHTYNEETAELIFEKILQEYYAAFVQFRARMEELRSGKQGTLL